MQIHRLLSGAVTVVVFLVACGDDPSDVSTGSTVVGSTISATLEEWKVQIDADSVGSGDVVFSLTNEGTIGHEFLVVRTDIEDGKIPLANGQFDEKADGVDVIGEVPEIAVGSSSVISLRLSSGRYQLACNLPGHYQAGMHASLTVTE